MDKTSLGDRMKGYEAVPQNILMKRTPVIIRVDGKAFHTFTKRLEDKTPFSQVMSHCMISAASYLTHYVQGACFAYGQSDEISLLLRDWQTFDTQQLYGGKVQKIVSISAAMATSAFYATYEKLAYPIEYTPERPLFDSRVFNVPYEEVVNYFVWRQKDAMRNSVNMLGQYHFSHKQLQGKKVPDVKEMLMEQKTPWEDQSLLNQRGFVVEKTHSFSARSCNYDAEIPIFTEDREYIEKWLGDYDGES